MRLARDPGEAPLVCSIIAPKDGDGLGQAESVTRYVAPLTCAASNLRQGASQPKSNRNPEDPHTAFPVKWSRKVKMALTIPLE